MKVLSKFLNILFFIVTIVVVMLAQYAVYAGISFQSEDTSRIQFVPNGEKVDYIDTCTFWGDSMKVGFKSGNHYYVRNWSDYDWWDNGMKWADVAIDGFLNVVSPLFAPVYEIENIRKFYGKSIDDFRDEINSKNPQQGSYFDDAVKYKSELGKADVNGKIRTEARFAQYYKTYYEYEYKINKYNNSIYEKYSNQFIQNNIAGEDEEGNPIIVKTLNQSIVMAYYQIYLAVLLALYIVCQNPITIKKNDDNVGEVSGNMLPKLPGFKRKNKKNKNNKKEKGE